MPQVWSAHQVTRRGFLGHASTASVAAALLPRTAHAAVQSGIDAPVARRVADVRSQLGRTRTDHYSWMKHVPDKGTRSLETLPTAIRDHLVAENAYAEAVLAPTAAEERVFYEQMSARLPSNEGAPPLRRGEWDYWTVVRSQQTHPVHRRRNWSNGIEQLLLDEAARAEGHAYYRTTGHQVSVDGSLFAWAEDIVGDDRHRVFVRDIASGDMRIIVERDGYGYGGLVFSPSSQWLFWIWRDARNRPTRVYRSAVKGGQAELVYEEADPAIFMQIDRTAANGFVAITLSGPDTSEVRLIRADAETEPPEIVRPRRRGHRYRVDEWDGPLIALVADTDAPDGKIVLLDRSTFAERGDLVPHTAGTQIVQLLPFRSALVRLEWREALPRLVLTSHDRRDTPIAFGGEAYALTMPPGQDFGSSACRIMFEGPATPPRWIELDLKTRRQTVLSSQAVAGFDAARFDVQRLHAPAPDGEMVPITLLTLKGARRDGTRPLMLYGYGAYGVSSEAAFAIPPTVLVERGWNYAIAHVRGGSEKGRRWFLDGRRDKKHNSFLDFIACARHLCALGYGVEGRAVAYGLSAGGLLVAASMNMAPKLWGGVIAKVPFVDMLNTMSDASHPLVPLFRPDWGDPLSDPKAYDYMASISPYENIRPAPYPPLLTTAGLKDDRVGYWEPAKLVASLRAHSTSEAPALLLTDMAAGHQGTGGRAAELKEMARFYAFAQACVDGRLASRG